VASAIIREAADIIYVAPNTGFRVGGAVEGKGGDFATLGAAIAHARQAGCSASRPFIIRAAPAVYAEPLAITGGENDDLGLVIEGDPFAVIASDAQHVISGFRPGFIGFENILFRGSIAGPLYQLQVVHTGLDNTFLPNFQRHCRWENLEMDGGGNFAYVSSRDVHLQDVYAQSKAFFLNCGRPEVANCDLALVFQALDATTGQPYPTGGARGSRWRESTLFFGGRNSFVGDPNAVFSDCDIKGLGLGPNAEAPPVQSLAEARFCGFNGSLDLLGLSVLTEYGCTFDVVPTLAVGALIAYSQSGVQGALTYAPPVTLAAVAVPAAGDFPGQFVFVTDTRIAWGGAATPGFIYWNGAAWKPF
jgi:hypothetical protein